MHPCARGARKLLHSRTENEHDLGVGRVLQAVLDARTTLQGLHERRCKSSHRRPRGAGPLETLASHDHDEAVAERDGGTSLLQRPLLENDLPQRGSRLQCLDLASRLNLIRV